jgi:hydrogenase/urease accessory protein HupE
LVSTLETRDIVALVIVVGAFIALILRVLSPEQAVAIITAVLGYYFGYKYGYERGVESARREKEA